MPVTVQRVGTMLTPFFTDGAGAQLRRRQALRPRRLQRASSTPCSRAASTSRPRPSRPRSRRPCTATRSSPPWRPRWAPHGRGSGRRGGGRRADRRLPPQAARHPGGGVRGAPSGSAASIRSERRDGYLAELGPQRARGAARRASRALIAELGLEASRVTAAAGGAATATSSARERLLALPDARRRSCSRRGCSPTAPSWRSSGSRWWSAGDSPVEESVAELLPPPVQSGSPGLRRQPVRRGHLRR